MASTRALLPFAVFAAFTACSMHTASTEAQQLQHHTVTITVDEDRLDGFLEHGDPPIPEIETDPDPFYLSPDDTVTFQFEGGPWMLQPQPLSPFDRAVVHGRDGEEVTVTVREQAMRGVYKSIIAVYVNGRVFVADPHFIID